MALTATHAMPVRVLRLYAVFVTALSARHGPWKAMKTRDSRVHCRPQYDDHGFAKRNDRKKGDRFVWQPRDQDRGTGSRNRGHPVQVLAHRRRAISSIRRWRCRPIRLDVPIGCFKAFQSLGLSSPCFRLSDVWSGSVERRRSAFGRRSCYGNTSRRFGEGGGERNRGGRKLDRVGVGTAEEMDPLSRAHLQIDLRRQQSGCQSTLAAFK